MSKHLNKIVPIIAIMLFSGVGAYVLQQSKADPYVDNLKNQNGGVYFLDEKRAATYKAGQSYFLTVYANVPNSVGHLDIEVGNTTTYTRYRDPPGNICGDMGACSPFPTSGGFDFGTCIDVASDQRSKKQVKVLTIYYDKLDNFSDYSTAVTASWRIGSCASRSVHGYRAMDNSTRVQGMPDQAPAQHGMGGGAQGADFYEGGGPGEGAGPTDSTNQGTGNSGAGSGGGGSSSAQKQSNTPNPLPTAAPQGDATEQPDIEPSPFFDGKDFEKGSDSDTFSSSVSKTSTRLVHGWYYVVAAIVLGGFSGLLYWRWKK